MTNTRRSRMRRVYFFIFVAFLIAISVEDSCVRGLMKCLAALLKVIRDL